MWTAKNRKQYDCSKLRYPSDLTDEEWAHVALLIQPARRGDKRHVDVREVPNGTMYVLGTGCQWRAIPKDLPPRSTLFDYFDLWSWDKTLERAHHALYALRRGDIRQKNAKPISLGSDVMDSELLAFRPSGGLHRSNRSFAECKTRENWGNPDAAQNKDDLRQGQSQDVERRPPGESETPVTSAGRQLPAGRPARRISAAPYNYQFGR